MKDRIPLRSFLSAVVLEGLISIIWLLLIPGDPKSTWILGLSKTRLILLIGLIFILSVSIYFTYRAYKDHDGYQRTTLRLTEYFNHPKHASIGAIIAGLGFLAGCVLIIWAFSTTDLFIQSYLHRLTPIVFWVTAIAGKIFYLIFRRHAGTWKLHLGTKREFFLYAILVLFISAVVFKVSTYNITRWNKLPDAAYGIITGKPHWRAYSNRLLGPYTVLFISRFGISFEKALEVFYFLMVCVQNLVLFTLLSKDPRNSLKRALSYTIYFSFLFIIMQDYYSYTWDYIDLVIFILFAWGILKQKSTSYFAALFFVELLNREIALLIAFYLILDAFHLFDGQLAKKPKFSLTPVDKKKLFTGSFLVLFGAVYTKLIRDFLFIESALDYVGNDLDHLLIGNHFQLVDNLKSLFIDNFSSMDIINSIFIIAILAYFSIALPKYNRQQFKAFIMLILTMVSIFTFGLINETRMFLITIPFILFLHIELEHQQRQKQQISSGA